MNGSKYRSLCHNRLWCSLCRQVLCFDLSWGEGKEFYLKSGKPQEVTLKSSCHCIPANRQTIHQPTHMCSRACGETHNPTNTARLHMDGRVWRVIYIPRVVITQTDTHAERPTFTNTKKHLSQLIFQMLCRVLTDLKKQTRNRLTFVDLGQTQYDKTGWK